MFPIESLRIGLNALNFTNDSLPIWSSFVFFFPHTHSFFFHYIIIIKFSLPFSKHQHLFSTIMNTKWILLLIVKVHTLVFHQAKSWQNPRKTWTHFVHTLLSSTGLASTFTATWGQSIEVRLKSWQRASRTVSISFICFLVFKISIWSEVADAPGWTFYMCCAGSVLWRCWKTRCFGTLRWWEVLSFLRRRRHYISNVIILFHFVY